MKKYLFVFCILSNVFLSCKENIDNTSPSSNESQNVKLRSGQIRARLSQQSLAIELSKDSYFIEYNKTLSETMDDIANNKYNIRGLNKAILASALAETKKDKKTFEDITKAYKKAGIVNPEGYLKKNIKLLYHWGKIIEKYPELKEMTKKERKLLFSKISKQLEIDVKKLIQQNKNK